MASLASSSPDFVNCSWVLFASTGLHDISRAIINILFASNNMAEGYAVEECSLEATSCDSESGELCCTVMNGASQPAAADLRKL